MLPRGPQAFPGQERRLRLLAFVRQDSVVRVDKRIEDTAMVWPHLLVIEFIAMMLFTVGLFALSALVNAPLLDQANPDRTPNPSKAPWYFLNLQELLLHMHPALAGVIVPTVALVLLAAIPYVDRGREGVGTYFHSAKGKAIALFSAVFTGVVTMALIFIDAVMKASAPRYTTVERVTELGGEILEVREGTPMTLGVLDPGIWIFPQGYAAWADAHLPGGKAMIPDIIIPTFLMLALPVLLVMIVKQRWNADRREWMIALFTGFITVYLLLVLVGTAMRGPGMDLFMPWAVPPPHD